jgi:DNA replication initiation complex subunit (GINS family)
MKLSYELIRSIHRQEKDSNELVKIDDDFFDEIPEFVTEEKSKLQDIKKNLDDSVIRKINNIKTMLMDIISWREKKIINKAILKTKTNEDDIKNMTLEEQKIYYKLVNILHSYQLLVKNSFEEIIEDQPKKIVKLKILQDVPKFIGTDMKEYGPYEKDSEIELIESIAKIFIKKDIGKEII